MQDDVLIEFHAGLCELHGAVTLAFERLGVDAATLALLDAHQTLCEILASATRAQ